MNKYFLISLISTIALTSCNKDLDCNSDIAKQNVKEILIDVETKGKMSYNLSKTSKTNINDIIENYIEIKNVRTVNKNEELKSCECRATLTFNLDEKASKKMKSKEAQLGAMLFNKQLLNVDGTEIYYNIQETADGEIYTETYEIDGLDATIIMLNKYLISNKKGIKKGTILNFASKENNGENKYQLKFLNDNKIEIKYSYLDFTNTEIAEFNNGKIIIDGNDDVYILENDIFKAYNPESQTYDLHYKK